MGKRINRYTIKQALLRPVRAVSRALDGKVPRLGKDSSLAVPFAFPFTTGQHRLAAVCHIFYPDLCAEIRDHLALVPQPLDVFISTDTEEKRDAIASAFTGWTSGKIVIRVVANRGRDIAPKFVTFRDVYPAYDLVVFLHGKKTLTSTVGTDWRKFLFANLLGSKEIIASILYLFESDLRIGMVGVQHYEPIRYHITWGGSFDISRQLADRMSIPIRRRGAIDFPSGSMFWCRTAALKPLLDLNLQLEEFADEQGQTDGTFAHGIERLLYWICEKAGYRWVKIAVPGTFASQKGIVAAANEEQLRTYVETATAALTMIRST